MALKWSEGYTKQKGRIEHLGIPVFYIVAEENTETKANASVIYVPPPFAVVTI